MRFSTRLGNDGSKFLNVFPNVLEISVAEESFFDVGPIIVVSAQVGVWAGVQLTRRHFILCHGIDILGRMKGKIFDTITTLEGGGNGNGQLVVLVTGLEKEPVFVPDGISSKSS